MPTKYQKIIYLMCIDILNINLTKGSSGLASVNKELIDNKTIFINIPLEIVNAGLH